MYNVTVTVQYGGQVEARQYPNGATIGHIMGDRDLKAVMGFGDNVRYMVQGIEQPHTAVLSDGVRVFVETRANSKAN